MKYNGHDIADNEFHSELASSLVVSDGCCMGTEAIEKLFSDGREYIRQHTEAGNRYSDRMDFLCNIRSGYSEWRDEDDMVEISLIAERYETELERETRIGREKEYWDRVDAKKPDYEAMRRAERKMIATMRNEDELFCRYEYEREIMKKNGCTNIPSFNKWKKCNGIIEQPKI
jgi:hypothetical protein